MARPRGDLNPCLRPDATQVNCAVEQAVDPDDLEDPLFEHALQGEVVMGGAPSGSQHDYESTPSDLYPSAPSYPSTSGSQYDYESTPSYLYPSASSYPSTSGSQHYESTPSHPYPSAPSHPLASSYPSTSATSYPPTTMPSYPPISQFGPPSPYGSDPLRHITGRLPSAVRSRNIRAAPYVLPGLRFVPAYAPLRANEEVRGGVITGGVFRVSSLRTYL